MLRSLYSGISGMKNFQTKLDVIGNNIANVNTTGFKKGRVTFKDAMNQTMAGASASTINRGGKNAMQVGLGSTIATIDTITTGSSLQTTSRPLDLGIDGDGYFVVKNGNQQFYTRAGNFYLDDNGSLVNADGLKVQAYQYDKNGNFAYGDVTVNVNAVMPPVTTKNLEFSGNLAANANIGSIFSKQIKTVNENGNPQSATIYFKKLGTNNWGEFINEEPKPSEVGTISQIAPVPTPPPNDELITGDISVLNQGGYTGTNAGTWKIKYDPSGVSPNSNYQIDIADGNGYKSISSANISNGKFTQDGLQIDLSNLNIPTTTSPYVPIGEWSFDVTPAVAGSTPSQVGTVTQIATVPAPLPADELITGDISVSNPEGFTGTSNGTWNIRYNASPTNPSDSNYEIDAGSGTYTPIPSANISNGKFTQDGLEIDLSKLSIPTTTPPAVAVGEWRFSVISATAPNHTLNFDANGKILSSSAKVVNERIDVPSGKVDDTSTAIDESKLLINLDFSNLTQIDGVTTALVNPDGNTEGKLDSFNVGSSGEINGVYSNGLIKTLGQIAIAKFSNSSGLTKTGGNLFQETVNSGTADINVAGNGRGSIAAGSLEMSNVDLSEEFTEMIIAQRGFQANTKIITTSDDILQELVNLKR